MIMAVLGGEGAKKPVYERRQGRRAVKRVMPYFARSADKASQGVRRESRQAAIDVCAHRVLSYNKLKVKSTKVVI